MRELTDHGPRYAETALGRFPVEPVNTLSNLIFLAVLILLVWRLTTKHRWTPFFFSVAAILFIGWIGGTIYHATRSSVVWLLLDWVPIAVLCLMGATWFSLHLEPRTRRRMLFVGIPLLLLTLAAAEGLRPAAMRIGGGYAVLAAAVELPAILHCAQNRGRRAGLLLGAVGSFAVALGCRFADAHFIGETPRLGTHFLWHLFGGLAAYFVLEYLWRDVDDRASAQKTPA